MPFIIQRECKCCRDMLWHCKSCWTKYHHDGLPNDYIPPSWYGQPMFGKLGKEFKEEFNIEFNPIIKEDKTKKYKEGEYH